MAEHAAAKGSPGIISFFAGCGILDLGFEASGFRTCLANEINKPFAEAYEAARTGMDAALPEIGEDGRSVVRRSIDWFVGEEGRALLSRAMASGRADGRRVGFIGGPPCPDFSIAGKQAGHTGENGRLTRTYFDLIRSAQPDFFLFENVKGLVGTQKHKTFFEAMQAQMREAGYSWDERVLNAIEFGAPQDRYRVIAIGFRKASFGNADAMAADFFDGLRRTHDGALGQSFWPGMDVLDRDGGGEPQHTIRPEPCGITGIWRELTVKHWFDRNGVTSHANSGDCFKVRAGITNMRKVREGDTNYKSFKRLHRHRYSPTAAYGNNEVHLHPWLDRRITVAEAMALQTLPAAFVLPKTMTLSAMFKTVGNGVPFVMARAIGNRILEVLDKADAGDSTLPDAGTLARAA